MEKKGFSLTKEKDLFHFLGVDIKSNKSDKTIEMTQIGLIDKILKTTGMVNCNGK